MLNYTFVQSVKVLTQRGAASLTGEVLSDAGYKKAFLVFDEGMRKVGILDIITKSLKAKGIEYVEYDKVMPDPTSTMIDEGAALCKETQCDCVVAIGGGSSIDAAKGINILRFNEGSILDYATKPMNLCTGLITIPTTSGTGSELSNGAIVSDVEHDAKVPVLCFNNMSEYTILDPTLTLGLPYGMTLMTGLDVLSHCMEAYTAIGSNPMTDLVCEKMISTVIEYLPKVLANPTDIDAREKMQCAASIGGWMLYNACAHVGHSIAHVIGAHFHIVHGKACAYGVPSVLKAIASAVPHKVAFIAKALGKEVTTFDDVGDVAANAYKEFVTSLQLPEIESYDISDEEFNQLVQSVVNEPFASLTPVKVDEQLATKMLKEIFSK